MKTLGKVILVLFILAIVIGSFFTGTWYVKNKAEKEAELITSGFKQTAIEITNSGNIPIVVNNTIQWIPINQLCRGQ